MKILSRLVGLAGLLAIIVAEGRAADATAANAAMNPVAETYVRLVLALGVHDDGYVDAYHGPAEWKTAAAAEKLPLAGIRERERAARAQLAKVDVTGLEEIVRLRHRFLDEQLAAMEVRIDLIEGRKVTFDDESRLIYGAVAPKVSDAELNEAVASLERLVPGTGTLAERMAAFRRSYLVPKEKLPEVMKAAIAESRRRTRAKIALPESEGFTFELVSGNSWSAYNWYQGKFQSLIQVETSKPVYIDRIIDLACHEGYPGHHVANVLLEDRLLRGRGWIEFSVYPLYSPLSLIAEGSGNYAVTVAFPAGEKLAFERDVLYPLAGLDPARAEALEQFMQLKKKLRRCENELSRRLVDGVITPEQARAWQVKLGRTPAEADSAVRFTQHYRSYVVNYSLGEDLVREYLEKLAGTDRDRRWQEFERLIASPRLPSGLQ